MPESRKIDHEVIEIERSDQDVLYEGYKFGRPGLYTEYHNDFHQFAAADWVITTTEAGGGDASEAVTDETGGVLLLTNDAGDDDLDSLQLVGESFLPAANKNIYFEAKVKISDATQSDMLVGLVVTDTTPLAHANGISFRKDDGDTNLDFRSSVSSADDDDAGIHTVVADVYMVLGFRVNGLDSIDYYVDGIKKGSVNSVPSTEMAITVHIQNGEAVAKTMSIDYINVSQEK